MSWPAVKTNQSIKKPYDYILWDGIDKFLLWTGVYVQLRETFRSSWRKLMKCFVFPGNNFISEFMKASLIFDLFYCHTSLIYNILHLEKLIKFCVTQRKLKITTVRDLVICILLNLTRDLGTQNESPCESLPAMCYN